MCGIAGLLDLHGAAIPEPRVRSMIDRLHHRGPDGSGIHAMGPVALGHTRLSIIDVAGGAQPMSNEDGSVWVTFNGEIFNYLELRDDLIARGHRFATRSDTEVIVHAWEERGPDCVRDFNGQWAFALWDARQRTLLLSRDRLGVRPLFHARVGNQLAFASEVKALFALPELRRAIDPIGLDQVFTFWSTVAPRTIFEGVQQVPPGCSLLVRGEEIQLRRHFSLDFPDAAPNGDLAADTAAEELLGLLADATRLRLRADVPVGAYLSGGLDSTLITSLVKRQSRAPLATFSVTFDDPEFDESAPQREAVDFLGIAEHHSLRCRAADIGRVFPEVVWHAEQPLVRTAPAPLFLLSRAVRDAGYKVVLTGEGADEVFGGYDLFKEAKVRRFWARAPQSKIRPLLLRKLYPYLPNLKAQPEAYLRAFFHARPEELASPLFSHLPRFELTSRIKLFYGAELRGRLAGHDACRGLVEQLPPRFGVWDPLCQAQYLETSGLLPGYILSSQGDRVALAHGVEGRFPFLDPRIVEFGARLPPLLKLRALDEKHLLKRAARGLVPPSIARRSKQPYRAYDVPSFFDPQTRQAREEYVEAALAPAAVRRAGLFDEGAVARLADKARSGQISSVKDSMALVAVLSTQLLHQQFIERSGSSVNGT